MGVKLNQGLHLRSIIGFLSLPQLTRQPPIGAQERKTPV